MVTKSGEKKGEAKEEKRPEAIMILYRKRLQVLRLAQQHFQQDNIPKAVEGYLDYLNILGKYFRTKEADLKPALFNLEKEMAEILMISQVYWGLAKAYDRNSRLQAETKRCLDQFVKFSLGFKFQYINSKMLKKFIGKKMAYNPKLFQAAYEQIQVDSKSCFVATHCFESEDHPVVEDLRKFKRDIIGHRPGYLFVEFYYNYFSPFFLSLCGKSLFLNRLITAIFRPALYFFSKTYNHLTNR